MSVSVKVEGLTKTYQLGEISSQTLARDFRSLFIEKSIKNEKKVALKNISFEIQQGDVLGIIGKNGSGKSTLLKILSRVTSPTEGKVGINGNLSALLEVGTAMHPDLTGRENIYLNGGVLGMSKKDIDIKIDEIIAFFGYPNYIDTPIKRYSSGMKIRLGFSVAAFLDPDILVIDEVLAVGDLEFQKKAIEKTKSIVENKEKTIIFVSHNLSLIRQICNRIIVLNEGSMFYNGDVERGIEKYLSINFSKQDTEKLNYKDLKPSDIKRYGNGHIRFLKAEIYGLISEKKIQLRTGEKAQLQLDLSVEKPIDYDKLIVSISMYKPNENHIVRFFSDEMGMRIKPPKNKHITLLLDIPKLMLREGDYQLGVSINTIDLRSENTLDGIEDVMRFNVASTDYWNSGALVRKVSEGFMDAVFFQKDI